MAGRIAPLLVLVIGSVLFSLLVLELGVRLASGPQWLVHWPNIVLEERLTTRQGETGRTVHDPRLGFVGRAGYADQTLHYDQRGFRVAPAPEGLTLAQPPILVVGDSYAHGNEIADRETWPARLQKLVGRAVVNAAMSGYGIDQMVLRAEKPYFESVDGALVLRNVPVPPPHPPADTLSIWQRLFGYSLLVDTILRHQGWQYEWSIDHVRVLSPEQGERQVCPLMRRLAGLGLPTMVVAEYDRYVWVDADYAQGVRRVTDIVLKCAVEAGFATLDMFAAIDQAVRTRGLAVIYGDAHPSPAGTEITAQRIADELKKRQMVPPP